MTSSRTTPLPTPLVGVLENIRSMGNVGSMFRSADGAGISRLMLCGFTPHPPRDEIDKTALGATDYVPWEYWTTTADAVRWLRETGHQVIALEATPASQPLAEATIPGPTAFVVGHEVSGISREVLDLCDEARHIPMVGEKSSLNVAVAFGIAAFGIASKVRTVLDSAAGL